MKALLPLFTLSTLLCCAFSFSAFAQSADETAIKNLIYQSTEASLKGDYDTWAMKYAHDSDLYATGVSPSGNPAQRIGWEKFNEYRKNSILANAQKKNPSAPLIQENMIIKVNGNVAWAYYDQTEPNGNKSWQHRVLEKRNGEWKIVSLISIYHDSSTKEAAKN
ncbi:MAG: YybH family protein [Saprospiraceae bacterium]